MHLSIVQRISIAFDRRHILNICEGVLNGRPKVVNTPASNIVVALLWQKVPTAITQRHISIIVKNNIRLIHTHQLSHIPLIQTILQIQ